ncbi:MAG: chemotaxis response regulator protein-glutamate methylesterase [Oscillospiraceae bacterium]|nr:chemotaxis response regulator protein-glutamate methylesterase [Oscillospiraceae bacterium]
MTKTRPIRVLITDDSEFFCSFLEKGLTAAGFDVVGTAHNPYDARDKILELTPDVLTLDVEMPRMNGISFLKKLIPQYPIPCVVVSSAKVSCAEVIKAGGADFLTKPADGENTSAFFAELTRKLIRAANVVPARSSYAPAKPKSERKHNIIAIGASTGGTDAIEEVLMGLPEDIPPIVIVQHMPPVFTQMYAQRLNKSCKFEVREAVDGDTLHNGLCLVAAGDKHMRLAKKADGYFVKCAPGEKVSGHCPSVDVLFESVAGAAGADALGVILTGMGSDGACGMKLMRDNGAYTIGQDEKSCVVYGMPMEAFKLGGVCEQQPLSAISGAILKNL